MSQQKANDVFLELFTRFPTIGVQTPLYLFPRSLGDAIILSRPWD